jgi:hypothetical protein
MSVAIDDHSVLLMAVRKGNFVCLLHWHSQHKHFFKRLFNQHVRSLKDTSWSVLQSFSLG